MATVGRLTLAPLRQDGGEPVRLELHRKEQRKEQRSSLICIFWAPNFCELKQQSLSGCHLIGLFHCALTNVSSSATAPLFHHLFRLLLYSVATSYNCQVIPVIAGQTR